MKKIQSQSGQILLIVIVFMTIALALGISISLRSISSISRVSDVDTTSRVLAAAEGGAESFLQKSTQELVTLKSVCTGNYSGTVPTQCVVTYNPITNDAISSQAVVTVEDYYYTEDPLSYIYTLNIDDGDMKEINLEGIKQDVMICWASMDSSSVSTPDLYFTVIDANSIVLQKGVSSGSIGKPASYNAHGFDSSSVGSTDCDTDTNAHTYRLNLIGYGNLSKLRIKSIAGASKVQVYSVNPAKTPLPVQGFKITSTGSLTSSKNISAEVENTTKITVVYKPYPYVTGLLDFGMYSIGGLAQ